MQSVPVTVDNFEKTLEESGILILDFWASWCAPCRMFAPVFESAAQKHPDIVFGKVNTEEQPGLASAFEIQSIPTIAAFKDGILVFRQPGALPGPALEALVGQLRELDMAAVRRQLQARQEGSVR